MSEPKTLRADEDVLGDLHIEVAKQLAVRIKSGQATAAEFTAAINFLRANDIKAIPAKDTPLETLGRAVAESGVDLPIEGLH
jgi:hypothetical protein